MVGFRQPGHSCISVTNNVGARGETEKRESGRERSRAMWLPRGVFEKGLMDTVSGQHAGKVDGLLSNCFCFYQGNKRQALLSTDTVRGRDVSGRRRRIWISLTDGEREFTWDTE